MPMWVLPQTCHSWAFYGLNCSLQVAAATHSIRTAGRAIEQLYSCGPSTRARSNILGTYSELGICMLPRIDGLPACP